MNEGGLEHEADARWMPADVSRGLLWMYEDDAGNKIPGLSSELQHLWSSYRPEQNLPNLEYIKKLDAELQSSQ